MITAQLPFLLRWRNLGSSIYLHHIEFLILFSLIPTNQRATLDISLPWTALMK